MSSTLPRLLLFLLLFIPFTMPAQVADYGRAILDTLCSPEMHGRGYYARGDSIAAAWLHERYGEIGLKPFGEDYYQRFSITVNAINGAVRFGINGTNLTPGEDYIIHPSAPKFAATLQTINFPSPANLTVETVRSFFPQAAGKAVVVDHADFADASKEEKQLLNETIHFMAQYPDLDVRAVIEVTEGNLTYTAAQQTAGRPHVIVKKAAIPKKVKSVNLIVNSEYTPDYATQNVIGYIEGEISDTFIGVCAHYDHIGRMGPDIYFPGANDNASGTAMMVTLANHFAKTKPKYSLVFFAFGAEEIGLLGSAYYVDNPLFPLDQLKFLLNLDILGTGDDGIQVVNGSEYQAAFDRLVELNTTKDLLKQVKIRGERCNSDHCHFHEKGVQSFFIYTLGGIGHYHNIYDKSETLPLTEFDDLFQLLSTYIQEF